MDLVSCCFTAARAWIIRSLLQRDGLLSLTDEDIDSICRTTDGNYFSSFPKKTVILRFRAECTKLVLNCYYLMNVMKEQLHL
jgi:hypothetical protein